MIKHWKNMKKHWESKDFPPLVRSMSRCDMLRTHLEKALKNYEKSLKKLEKALKKYEKNIDEKSLSVLQGVENAQREAFKRV